ncbi:bifunctional oligoribonuclease/PAP phosphatase NrnA, partial [bacterium]|nr:bifunctional oligoribonuclease/PAP phosphatase NrnA [bacterium]
MQNYPDPDALASAAALREFAKAEGISSTLTSGGVVGRAENRALLRYLRLPLRHMNKLDFSKFDAVALVDSQPDTGNKSLPVVVKS